jgi:hypothetical protein
MVGRAIHGNDDIAALGTFPPYVAAYSVLSYHRIVDQLHFIVIIGESEAGFNMPRTAKPLQIGRSQLLFKQPIQPS